MVEFKKFKVSELFDYKRGKESAPKKVPEGDIPLISETSSNNGFVRGASSTHVFPAKTITVSVNYAQTVFLQPKEFCASVNIIVLVPKFGNVPDAVLLYFVALLRANNGVYDYNYKISKDRLMNTVLLVPVTPAGDPDFEYMTMRIRELEAQRIRELEAYLRVTGLNDITLSASEAQALTQNVQWKKFRIGDVFDKKTVKGYPKKIEDLTSVSDGYHTFGQNIHYQHCQRIKMPDKYLFKVTRPILAYASSTGSVGMINESFYRSGDNGAFQALLPKFDDKRVTTMLFILVVMKRIFAQFNYNTNVRGILDMDILLPVTPDNEIDFNYMQNYIRAMEKQTIKGVVEYKDKVIQETRKVVNG